MFGIVTAKMDKSDSGKWCLLLLLLSDCSVVFYIISANLKLSGHCLGPSSASLGFGHMDSLVDCLFMVWAVIFLCDCLHKNCVILFFFAHFSSSQRCKEHLLITNQQDADRLSCEQPMNPSFIFDYMTLHHLLEVQPLARNLEPFACRMRRGIKKQNIKYIRKK